jgi:hypothetical protein
VQEGDKAAALAASAKRSEATGLQALDQSKTQPPAQAKPPPSGESAAEADDDGVEVRCTSFIFPFTNPALHLVRFPSLTPCPVQILSAEQFSKMKQQQELDRKRFASVIVAAQNSSAAKRKSSASDKLLSKKQKSEQSANPPDKETLKKAVLYFSAASKLAALTTEELEQFLATNKPV